MNRRPCQTCGKNRAERFFVSERGRICVDCQRKRRRTTSRSRHVVNTYGLLPTEHDDLLEHQGGVCAICDKPRPYELNVDHDHVTGYVRGLLCRRCNKLLRDVRDDRAVLRMAANYLDQPPARILGIAARPRVLATEGDQ